jgi:MFS family permease
MHRRPLILVALLLAAFAINLDTTIVNVALPTLVRELRASTTQLEWIVDAYNLMFAALVLAAGNLGDRVGRKGVLLAGLAVFGAATVAGGLGGSPVELIAARAVMGLGAALIFPATLSLLTNVFTERGERARDRAVGGEHGCRDRCGTDRRGLAARALLVGERLLRARPNRRRGGRTGSLERAALP